MLIYKRIGEYQLFIINFFVKDKKCSRNLKNEQRIQEVRSGAKCGTYLLYCSHDCNKKEYIPQNKQHVMHTLGLVSLNVYAAVMLRAHVVFLFFFDVLLINLFTILRYKYWPFGYSSGDFSNSARGNSLRT